MTTRQAVNKQDLANRIAQLVNENPSLSQRAVAKIVRSEGMRGSNTLIRSLVRIQKADSRLPAILRVQQGLTVGERARGGREAQRQSIALIEALGGKRNNTRLTGLDVYVSLEWEARITVEIRIQGRAIGQQTVELKGKIVQELELFTTRLINERIQTQVEGQVSLLYAQLTGGKAQSYIEGLSMRILRRQFIKTEVELRTRGRRKG